MSATEERAQTTSEGRHLDLPLCSEPCPPHDRAVSRPTGRDCSQPLPPPVTRLAVASAICRLPARMLTCAPCTACPFISSIPLTARSLHATRRPCIPAPVDSFVFQTPRSPPPVRPPAMSEYNGGGGGRVAAMKTCPICNAKAYLATRKCKTADCGRNYSLKVRPADGRKADEQAPPRKLDLHGG